MDTMELRTGRGRHADPYRHRGPTGGELAALAVAVLLVLVVAVALTVATGPP